MPTDAPHWPPKSPYQALLSSPSGRKKLQSRRDRNSASPSPSKRTPSTSGSAFRALSLLSDDEEEGEDEETLQLKLKAIEARLKLKKLQQAKSKQTAASSDAEGGSARGSSRPGTAEGALAELSRAAGASRPRSEVQIPLSPIKDRRTVQPPKSAARVVLGIDKGLKAHNVSLKRPSTGRGRGDERRQGHSESDANVTGQRPKSFSERIAESRLNDKERQEKEVRIRKARSNGFGLDSRDMNNSGSESAVRDLSTAQPVPKPATAGLSNQGFTPELAGKTAITGRCATSSVHPDVPQFQAQRASASRPPASLKRSREPASKASNRVATEDPSDHEPTESSIEPFTGFHLSKRLIPHTTLTRTLESKELYPLTRLLKTVKSPSYDPPDHEADYVVLGIIASKSTPRDTLQTHKTVSSTDNQPDRAKFMVLRLTDLKWEVDLFLFDSGFSRFWKLTPGTVIAVLNPGIMPPRARDTGAFSLKVASSEDIILELGTARDLGFCSAAKKDGRECDAWVDARKTEVCDFHVQLQLDRARRGRMEINTMRGLGSDPERRAWRPRSHAVHGFGDGAGGLKPRDGGARRDGDTGETYYLAATGAGRSTAALLDADEADAGAYGRGMSREELHRRRLADRERERELAVKLGRMGGGMGGEYMRVRHGDVEAAGREEERGEGALPGPPPDAGTLGLLRNRAGEVRLSPVKRKRGQGGGGGGFSEPMGWGGAYKRGLLSPSKTSAGVKKMRQRTLSFEDAAEEALPPKKRAKFMLEGKGIREPGRDSLGQPVAVPDNEDDDDLEII